VRCAVVATLMAAVLQTIFTFATHLLGGFLARARFFCRKESEIGAQPTGEGESGDVGRSVCVQQSSANVDIELPRSTTCLVLHVLVFCKTWLFMSLNREMVFILGVPEP